MAALQSVGVGTFLKGCPCAGFSGSGWPSMRQIDDGVKGRPGTWIRPELEGGGARVRHSQSDKKHDGDERSVNAPAADQSES